MGNNKKQTHKNVQDPCSYSPCCLDQCATSPCCRSRRSRRSRSCSCCCWQPRCLTYYCSCSCCSCCPCSSSCSSYFSWWCSFNPSSSSPRQLGIQRSRCRP